MIGFIGLGIMGKPMAKNLVKANIPLMVYDLVQPAVDELVALGAVAGTPRQIGSRCEIVFTILPNGAIVKNVLFGENGVALGKTAVFLIVVSDFNIVTALNASALRRNKSVEQIHQRGFSRARPPEDRRHLPLLHRKIDIVEGFDRLLARGVPFADAAHLDQRCHTASLPCWFKLVCAGVTKKYVH